VAWEEHGSPSDVYVANLAPDGSIIRKTPIGGSRDGFSPSVATDASGNVYVAGSTDSTDFPIRNALQSSFGGGICGDPPDQYPCFDAFVVKLGSTANIEYATCLGGSGEDIATSIAVSANGDVYVAGLTYSEDFPTVNALQSSFTEDGQAYVVKLSSTTTSNPTPTLLSSSPLPVTDSDQILGIALDPGGSVSIGGSIEVTIKVNPTSINLDEKRTVKVTILSSAAFDPGQVDTSTLTFGRTGTEVGPPVKCHAADKKLMCDFRADDGWFMLGDTQAVLNGLTYSGTSITGTDSIRIVPPKSKFKVMGKRKHHHGSRIWKLSTRTRHSRPHFDVHHHPARPGSHQRSH